MTSAPKPDQQPSETRVQLDERAQNLLQRLVETYLESGQPVGSRTLARSNGINVSPATIRNVMADLEDCGLLSAPHTSAGRVPTQLGLRLFVDSLVVAQPLASVHAETLADNLGGGFGPNQHEDNSTTLAKASAMLSELTQMAGVITIPRHEPKRLKQVEFLRLSGRRTLTILVFDDNEVQNRVIETEREFNRAELDRAANFISAELIGGDLRQLQQKLRTMLRNDQGDIDELTRATMELASHVKASSDEDFVLSGETKLMGLQDLADIDRLRQLFEAFQEKRAILHLLDQCLDADGVKIFIGEESQTAGLDSVSVVSSPYTVNGEVLGVLGVIGPTRMNYKKIIPIVDLSARVLGDALTHKG